MGKMYPKVRNGEWVQPIRKGYKMACCDCGLVHTMNFRIHKGKIQLQAFRNERSTAAIRRHMIKAGQIIIEKITRI